MRHSVVLLHSGLQLEAEVQDGVGQEEKGDYRTEVPGPHWLLLA